MRPARLNHMPPLLRSGTGFAQQANGRATSGMRAEN
jgi:hypothetical protein